MGDLYVFSCDQNFHAHNQNVVGFTCFFSARESISTVFLWPSQLFNDFFVAGKSVMYLVKSLENGEKMRAMVFLVMVYHFTLNAVCEWQTTLKPFSVMGAKDTIFMIIDEPMNPEFWAFTKPKEVILDTNKSWVLRNTPTIDPFELLKRQREIFARSGISELTNELTKFDSVINKEVGTIRDANCIELLLFAEHAKRFLGGEVLYEFDAIILEYEASQRIKIYYGSGKEESGGAPSLSRFNQAIRSDLENGYRMVYSLHNHPFFFGNRTGDIAGTTIPSNPDVQSYIKKKNEYGLRAAGITNGFSTIEISSAEFLELK